MKNFFKPASPAALLRFGFTAVARTAAVFCLSVGAGAAYIALEDMRAGLDARKSVVSAPAGTLREALNGHITPGGEFEKRKAFVQTSLPTGTYGLEATTNGLVTFGSTNDPGGWPRGSVVQYQRLQHPAVIEGATYAAANHALTSIVWSVCHEGLPFVAAAFQDGGQYLYYNGVHVTNSSAGLVFSGWSNPTNLTTSAANQMAQLSGWIAVAQRLTGSPGFTNWQVTIATPPSVTVSPLVSKVTTSGKLSAVFAGSGAAAVTGSGAVSTINITNAAGYLKIYAPTNCPTFSESFQYGLIELVNVESVAESIVLALNKRTGETGYTATNPSGNIVQITSPASFGQYLSGWSSNLLVVPYLGGFAPQNSPYVFTNGTLSSSGYGDSGTAVFFGSNSLSWQPGDEWTLTLVTSAETITIGKGNIAGRKSASAFSHANRLYLSLSNQFVFSSITDPTKFEDQDTGAGVVTFSSTLGALDTVQGIGEYQGGIAVAGKLTTQIWNTDPDPADFYLRQTLPIGTVSGQTIQALGKLDTLMLSDSGVRSLRVRDSSGNAIVEDVGTPIDVYLQAAMAGLTDVQKRAACSVVDPTAGRYWVYVPGNYIYVFSFYPLSGINAWSRYAPTFIQSSTNTWFAPQKFTVYSGQIFARSTNAVYAYGGTGGTNYDACNAVAETPFLNANTPGTYKSYNGLDLISEGIWTAKLGANIAAETNYVTVINGATNSTVTGGRPGLAARATHFKVRLEETGTGYARMSSVLLYYTPGESR